MAIGLGLYGAYGIRHSQVGREQGYRKNSFLMADAMLALLGLVLLALQNFFAHQTLFLFVGGALLALGVLLAAYDAMRKDLPAD
jgi:hypothetical protein